MRQQLGRSGIDVSAVGIGTWAIGGQMGKGTDGLSWGAVDDADAIAAIRYAIDQGVTFIDTANNYGCGHSERLIGEAIAGQRDRLVLATKFGYVCDAETREIFGSDVSETAIRTMLKQSLENLRTDVIDLYQLHVGNLDVDEALRVRDLLERLVDEGQIRTYGWSTNSAARIGEFVQGDHCVAIQHHFNLFERSKAVLDLCRASGVTSIARGPLAMGLLTGKYTHETVMPKSDFRNDWDCAEGEQAEQLERLAQVREILTREGHTLPQAALAWLLSYSDSIVPIPGFRTLEQVRDTVGVLKKGPLTSEQMAELDALLPDEEMIPDWLR